MFRVDVKMGKEHTMVKSFDDLILETFIIENRRSTNANLGRCVACEAPGIQVI